MKKIFINTTLPDLMLLAFDGDKIKATIVVENLIKKADNIKTEFKNLLNQAKWQVTDIESFYVITGPGSFMGARVGLLFARTICQILKTNLYILDSLSLIANNLPGKYSIDAKTGEAFQLTIDQNLNKEFALVKGNSFSEISNLKIISYFPNIFQHFTKVQDLKDVEPFYMKEPKVN